MNDTVHSIIVCLFIINKNGTQIVLLCCMKNIDKNPFDFFSYTDIFCFSHLRWGFVFQRPQHLLTRFADVTRVFYMEEPIFYDGENKLDANRQNGKEIYVLVPYLHHSTPREDINNELAKMVSHVIESYNIRSFWAWYYTPMALDFTRHLHPSLTVYDCMDELAAFKFAPAELKDREQELLNKADIVFTGGVSIYEAKKNRHSNVYAFPSSIDKEHFAQARQFVTDPPDQQNIPHPRLGFFGVIDERFDIDLIANVARQKPAWQFVIIGPVVKIDAQTLPQLNNIHYLGGKQYNELPHYLAGWDIAVIPFAINESTQYISPTKTPEYMAGGKPVISTPIKDVINPYGNNGLVHIAANAGEFITAAEHELNETNKSAWLAQADDFLKDNSWDNTWLQMVTLAKEKMKPVAA